MADMNNLIEVIIYAGRFQPMVSHHAQVYKWLVSNFPEGKVFIGTSDKTNDTDSPFTFDDKQKIAEVHGIPSEKVLYARRPYTLQDYKGIKIDPDKMMLIFAVGEKDVRERFPQDNVDPNTGLDMKQDGNEPKYIQMINTINMYTRERYAPPLPASKRAYIMPINDVLNGDKVASASNFRKRLMAAADIEAAKEIFYEEFGEHDSEVFDLVYTKIRNSNEHVKDIENDDEDISRKNLL